MRREKGFSLLEIMIAVFVLAIGLLGVAGLQLVSMKSGQSAFLRSQATLLAYSIVDDIRANRTSADDYAIDMIDDGDTSSDAAGLAGTDVNAWVAALGADLPGGKGTVDISGDRITVSVQWEDKGPQSQDGTKTVSLVTDIR